MSVFLVLLLLLPSVIGLCLLLRCGPEEGLLLTLFVLIAAVFILLLDMLFGSGMSLILDLAAKL